MDISKRISSEIRKQKIRFKQKLWFILGLNSNHRDASVKKA